MTRVTSNPQEAAPSAWNETAVLSALTAFVGIVAGVMVALGRAQPLEAFSFATGAIAVWLTVKESIWNFPIGLVNTATYSVVFYQARLYGDASLQIVYFVLVLIGWYLWLYGGERRSRLEVTPARKGELAAVSLTVAICALVLWRLLRLVGGSASFWDASTTSLSLGAQWLLNRKRIENWHFWIVVDILYVPLYISRGLNLTALLYALFLVMATIGLFRWRGVYEAAQRGTAAPERP